MSLEALAKHYGFTLTELQGIMDPPHENVILATVGLPRSGKSTWARETGYPIVSPDAIRLAFHGHAYNQDYEPWIWAIAPIMVESLFTAGHDIVVFDSTMITQSRRDAFERQHPKRNIIWVMFDVNVNRCLSRATPELEPVIQRMAAQLEWPENLIRRV